MSTLSVVERILRETGRPMSVRDIVEYAQGTLPTKSKTPDTVVARDLSMDIKKKGEESIFIRTSPGRYTMRCLVQQAPAPETQQAANGADGAHAEGPPPSSAPPGIEPTASPERDAAPTPASQSAPAATPSQATSPQATSMIASSIAGDRAGALSAEPKHSTSSNTSSAKPTGDNVSQSMG